MSVRHFKALPALILTLALLAACGPGPSTEPEPQPTSTTPPIATAPPTTAATEPTATEPPATEPLAVKEPVEVLDTASLNRSGLSIQRIFLCDDETLLVFVSPVNGDGTISEGILIYSYSFALGGFRPVSLKAGVVSLYPTGVLEDGTVTLVTLDSESYTHQSLIFLNPVTLETRHAPLPQDDFYDLHISPNGRYAAITTYDYLRVTDLSYETEYWRTVRTEGQVPAEDGAPFWDEWLPAATGWSADSGHLCYKLVSWAGDCPPGLVDTDTWTAALLPQLEGCALTPLDRELYTYFGIYNDLPVGLFQEAGDIISLGTDFLAADDALMAAVGHASGLLCLLTLAPQSGQGTAYVAQAAEDTLLAALGGRDESLTFEQAAFSPDGSRLVLLARPADGGPRQVLVWNFWEN